MLHPDCGGKYDVGASTSAGSAESAPPPHLLQLLLAAVSCVVVAFSPQFVVSASSHEFDGHVNRSVLEPFLPVCPAGAAQFAVSGSSMVEDKLLALDGATGDELGYSASISGEIALVGARNDDDQGGNSGSAYVFTPSDPMSGSAGWKQAAKLVPPDALSGMEYGWRVAISGTLALVGSRFGNAAYIFAPNNPQDPANGGWAQAAKLKASDDGSGFGYSVGISGTIAIVGARTGARAYMFVATHALSVDPTGGTWTERAKLVPADDGAFGASVAVSGTIAVIGSGSSFAYIFTAVDPSDPAEGGWQEADRLEPLDGVSSDEFGYSSSISGTVALVGSWRDDGDVGSAYIFTPTDPSDPSGTWQQSAKLVASDGAGGDHFGYSVSLSGTVALIGSYYDDDLGSLSGSAYLFAASDPSDPASGGWHETTKLLSPDGIASQQFGSAVSVSGSVAVVAAQGDVGSSGSAYIMRLAPIQFGNWSFDCEAAAATCTISAPDIGIQPPLSVNVTVVGVRGGSGNETALLLDTNVEFPNAASNVFVSVPSAALSTNGLGSDSGFTALVWLVQACGRQNHKVWASGAHNASFQMSSLASMPIVTASTVSAVLPRTRTNETSADLQLKLAVNCSLPRCSLLYAIDNDPPQSVSVAADPGANATVALQLHNLAAGSHRLRVWPASVYQVPGPTLFEHVWEVDLRAPVASLLGNHTAATQQVIFRAASEWRVLIQDWEDREERLSFCFWCTLQVRLGHPGAPLSADTPWTTQADPRIVRVQHGHGSGNYAMQLRAIDAAGNVGTATAMTSWIVRSAAAPQCTAGELNVAQRWSQGPELVPSDAADSTRFQLGRSLSICGSTAVVGANDDDDQGAQSGSATIFTATNSLNPAAGEWQIAAKLLSSDGDVQDRFGWSVSISGTLVLAGAYRDDDQGSNSGSAYVFAANDPLDPTGGGWHEAAKLLPSDGAGLDNFGFSVSISGILALVGAYQADFQGYENIGSAYLFTACDPEDPGYGGWEEVTRLVPSPKDDGSLFGLSVAISGTIAVVGAFAENNQGGSSGGAYIFTGETDWKQAAKVLPLDGKSGYNFGYSVSISGTVVLVGARRGLDSKGTATGSAYIFTPWDPVNPSTRGWRQSAKLLGSDVDENDSFGSSVSISGTVAVVGAFLSDGNTGSAYVFTPSDPLNPTGEWYQTAKLVAPSSASGGNFGRGVSISGTVALVGAPLSDHHSSQGGGAFIYAPAVVPSQDDWSFNCDVAAARCAISLPDVSPPAITATNLSVSVVDGSDSPVCTLWTQTVEFDSVPGSASVSIPTSAMSRLCRHAEPATIVWTIALCDNTQHTVWTDAMRGSQFVMTRVWKAPVGAFEEQVLPLAHDNRTVLGLPLRCSMKRCSFLYSLDNAEATAVAAEDSGGVDDGRIMWLATVAWLPPSTPVVVPEVPNATVTAVGVNGVEWERNQISLARVSVDGGIASETTQLSLESIGGAAAESEGRHSVGVVFLAADQLRLAAPLTMDFRVSKHAPAAQVELVAADARFGTRWYAISCSGDCAANLQVREGVVWNGTSSIVAHHVGDAPMRLQCESCAGVTGPVIEVPAVDPGAQFSCSASKSSNSTVTVRCDTPEQLVASVVADPPTVLCGVVGPLQWTALSSFGNGSLGVPLVRDPAQPCRMRLVVRSRLQPVVSIVVADWVETAEWPYAPTIVSAWGDGIVHEVSSWDATDGGCVHYDVNSTTVSQVFTRVVGVDHWDETCGKSSWMGWTALDDTAGRVCTPALQRERAVCQYRVELVAQHVIMGRFVNSSVSEARWDVMGVPQQPFDVLAPSGDDLLEVNGEWDEDSTVAWTAPAMANAVSVRLTAQDYGPTEVCGDTALAGDHNVIIESGRWVELPTNVSSIRVASPVLAERLCNYVVELRAEREVDGVLSMSDSVVLRYRAMLRPPRPILTGPAGLVRADRDAPVVHWSTAPLVDVSRATLIEAQVQVASGPPFIGGCSHNSEPQDAWVSATGDAVSYPLPLVEGVWCRMSARLRVTAFGVTRDAATLAWNVMLSHGTSFPLASRVYPVLKTALRSDHHASLAISEEPIPVFPWHWISVVPVLSDANWTSALRHWEWSVEGPSQNASLESRMLNDTESLELRPTVVCGSDEWVTGSYVLRIQAVMQDGSVSVTAELTWTAVPRPLVRFSESPALLSDSRQPTFRFDVSFADFLWSGEGLRVSYSLGDSDGFGVWTWASAFEAIVLGPLADGDFSVRARAVVGNGDGDRTGPVSTYSWEVAGSAAAVSLSDLAPGPHMLQVWPVSVWRVSGDMLEHRWVVDVLPPWITDVVNMTVSVGTLTTLDQAYWTVGIADAVGPSLDPFSCVDCDIRVRIGTPSIPIADASIWVALNHSREIYVDHVHGDGVYALEVTPVDNAGNVGAAAPSLWWRFDGTVPDTTIALLNMSVQVPVYGTPAWLSREPVVAVVLSASEPDCSFNVTTQANSSAVWRVVEVAEVPIQWSAPAQTLTTFSAAAIDVAGNVDATPAATTLFVDTLPPTSKLESAFVDGQHTSQTTFSANVSAVAAPSHDDVAGVQLTHSRDGFEVARWSLDASNTGRRMAVWPIQLLDLNAGVHRFVVSAVDIVRNIEGEETSAHVSWIVDLESPEVISVDRPPPITSSPMAVLAFQAFDKIRAADIARPCKFCGCSANVSLDGFATNRVHVLANASGHCEFNVATGGDEGVWSVVVAAHDLAAWTSAFVAEAWRVDVTPPIVTINATTTIGGRFADSQWVTNSSGMSLRATSNEPNCQLEWFVNGNGRYGSTDSSVTLSQLGLEEGIHDIQVRAIDEAGNVGNLSASISVVLDTTAPVTTFMSARPSSAVINSSTISLLFAASTANGSAIVGAFVRQQFSNEHEATDEEEEYYVSAASATSMLLHGSIPVHLNGLSDGMHRITVAAIDVAGNRATEHPRADVAVYSFAVDTVAPIPSWAVPPPSVSAASTVAVRVAVIDAHPKIAGACFMFHGASIPDSPPQVSDSSSCTFANTSGWVSFHLPESAEGFWSVQPTAIDAGELHSGALAMAAHHRILRVDWTAPDVQWLSTSVLPVAYTQHSTWRETVHFVVQDAGAVASAEVVVVEGGEKKTHPHQETVDFSLAAQGKAGSIPPPSALLLADGLWTLRVRAVDDAGLVGSWREWEWIVDTTSPVASVTTNILVATHSGDVANDAMLLDLPGAVAAVDEDALRAVDSLVGPPVILMSSNFASAAEVSVQFDSTCYDTASPCVIELKLAPLAQTPLSLESCTSSPSDSNTRRLAGTISGNATVAAALAQWTTVSAPLAPVLPPLVPEPRSVSASINTVSIADGSYRVLVRASDVAGNQAAVTAWRDLLVDTAAPLPPLVASLFGDNSEFSDATFDVSLPDDLSADPAATRFEFVLDADPDVAAWQLIPTPQQPLNSDGVAAATLTVGDPDTSAPGALQNGEHVLYVRATDAAGNVGQPQRRRWTVSTMPPGTVSVSGPQDWVVGRPFVDVRFYASADQASQSRLPNPRFETQLVGVDTGWQPTCDTSVAGSRGTLLSDGTCAVHVEVQNQGSYSLQARAKNIVGTVDDDPLLYSWQYSLCDATDEVAVLNETTGQRQCTLCPRGADCADPTLEKQLVQAQAGFWTPPSETSTFAFYTCPLPNSCLGSRPGPNGTRLPSGCAEGYTGRLCALCAPRFFKQFGRCARCPSGGTGSAVAVVVAVSFALVLLCAAAIALRKVLPLPILKIAISFLQVIGSANVVFRIEWPQSFEGVMNTFKVAMLDVLTLTRASCAAPMTFYASMVATLCVFVGLSAIGILLMVAHDGRQRRVEQDRLKRWLTSRASVGTTVRGGKSSVHRGTTRKHGNRRRSTMSVAAASLGVAGQYERTKQVRWSRVFAKLAQIWLLCYPGVSVKLMRVFVCMKVEGEWWLEADLRLNCFDQRWSAVAAVSIVVLLMYTVGLPVGIAVWLRSRRSSLDSKDTKAELGFLYEDYGVKSGQYLWEVEELLRKLTLTSLVLFFNAGSPFQICFALVVSAYAHVAHALWRPFVDRAAYLLQHLSLGVTTIVFAFGLLFKVDGLGNTASTRVMASLGILLVVLCAAVLVSSGILATARLVQRARRLRVAKKGGILANSSSPAATVEMRTNPMARPGEPGQQSREDRILAMTTLSREKT